MANKHKNRLNKETGDRQVRRSKADYTMSNETALKLFEASSLTVKDVGRQRLSTNKPVSLSAIDKNRFETQSKLGSGLCYILNNAIYLEYSIDKKIKRLCIGLIKNKIVTVTNCYDLYNDVAPYLRITPSQLNDRLHRYVAKYGYKLELT